MSVQFFYFCLLLQYAAADCMQKTRQHIESYSSLHGANASSHESAEKCRDKGMIIFRPNFTFATSRDVTKIRKYSKLSYETIIRNSNMYVAGSDKYFYAIYICVEFPAFVVLKNMLREALVFLLSKFAPPPLFFYFFFFLLQGTSARHCL